MATSRASRPTWDHLVGAPIHGEAIDVVAGEQDPQLPADLGEIEPEIGHPLAIDREPDLRQVDFQIGVGEHELAAREGRADQLSGIARHLLGRAGALDDNLDIVVARARQRRRQRGEELQFPNLRQRIERLGLDLVRRSLPVVPVLQQITAEPFDGNTTSNIASNSGSALPVS